MPDAFDQLGNYTVTELKQGYRFNPQENSYLCMICGRKFAVGEIFPIGGRFFDASAAVAKHVETEHGGALQTILAADSRYFNLTDNQKQILAWIGEGLTDSQIAAQAGVTASTVRHQRFMLRERAKQAKLYLAAFELAEQAGKRSERLVEPHPGATMTDDRYLITEAERDKILRLAFESLVPLRLRRFPPKEKKKLVILAKIAEQFTMGRIYAEPECNAVLKDIYEDYVTLRRYLIEYGFLERKSDCSAYWVKAAEPKGKEVLL